MFEEIIRKAWWKMFASLVANRVIREGEHFLFQDGMLYLSFRVTYEAYIKHVVTCHKPMELRVSAPAVLRILTSSDAYLFNTRKRLSKDVNLNVMVFSTRNISADT